MGLLEAPGLKNAGYADKFTNIPTEIEAALVKLMAEHNESLGGVVADFTRAAGPIKSDGRLTLAGHAEKLSVLAKDFGIKAMVKKCHGEMMPPPPTLARCAASGAACASRAACKGEAALGLSPRHAHLTDSVLRTVHARHTRMKKRFGLARVQVTPDARL